MRRPACSRHRRPPAYSSRHWRRRVQATAVRRSHSSCYYYYDYYYYYQCTVDRRQKWPGHLRTCCLADVSQSSRGRWVPTSGRTPTWSWRGSTRFWSRSRANSPTSTTSARHWSCWLSYWPFLSVSEQCCFLFAPILKTLLSPFLTWKFFQHAYAM